MAGYEEITSPVWNLTRRGIPFVWSAIHHSAFEKLRKCLLTPPILASPVQEKPFKIFSATSNDYVAAILCQESRGKQWILDYMGKSIPYSGCEHGLNEAKCVAVVNAVAKWHVYLSEKWFTVPMDENVLRWLFDKAPSVYL